MGKTLECLLSSPSRCPAMTAKNRAVEQAQQRAEDQRRSDTPPEECEITEFLKNRYLDSMARFHEEMTSRHPSPQPPGQ